MASEEDNALRLVNTNDDPDSRMINKQRWSPRFLRMRKRRFGYFMREQKEEGGSPSPSTYTVVENQCRNNEESLKAIPTTLQISLRFLRKKKMKFSTLLIEKQTLH
ncbi:hypothetical protein AHAS_Ahas03G0003500 [Arachis hypogaea]